MTLGSLDAKFVIDALVAEADRCLTNAHPYKEVTFAIEITTAQVLMGIAKALTIANNKEFSQ